MSPKSVLPMTCACLHAVCVCVCVRVCVRARAARVETPACVRRCACRGGVRVSVSAVRSGRVSLRLRH